MWSVVVFLLCASFPCVFLSQDSVGVARVLVLVGLGWFVCEVCFWGMGGWGSLVMWDGGADGCAVCAACVSSHVSMLMSGACPSIWHLSISDKHGAAVVLG